MDGFKNFHGRVIVAHIVKSCLELTKGGCRGVRILSSMKKEDKMTGQDQRVICLLNYGFSDNRASGSLPNEQL